MKDRWSQLSMSEKSDLMSLYIRNGISSLEEIKKHYNSFAEGGALPDYDPDNSYHYHNAQGEKIVITPEDWEANVGKPYFKEIEDAVKAEQAAHPEPEYEIDPNFVRDLRSTYAGNMGYGYYNYKNFQHNLPQGYSFTPEGVIIGPNGTAYVQSGYRQTPRFTYSTDNPLQFTINKGKPIERNLTFYPVNMDRKIKAPLPVDRIMNINNERENAIQNYINNNTKTIITQEPPIYKYINPVVNDYYLATTDQSGNTKVNKNNSGVLMEPSIMAYYNPETKTIETKYEYAPHDKIKDFHINRVKSFNQQVEEQDIRDAFKAAADMGINALYNYNSATYSTADDYLKDNRNKILISKGKTLKKQKAPSRQEAEEKAIISLLTNN